MSTSGQRITSTTGAREDKIHAGIVEYLRLVLPDAIVHHSPNGGLRTKSEASKLKWMGVVAGWPDIEILRPRGLVYFLEVKRPGSYLSPDQHGFRDHCERHGIPWALVRSIDDAKAALEGWRLPTREVAAG